MSFKNMWIVDVPQNVLATFYFFRKNFIVAVNLLCLNCFDETAKLTDYIEICNGTIVTPVSQNLLTTPSCR